MLATNLYRLLGKRTVSEKKTFKNKSVETEIKDSIFSEQLLEYSQKQILDIDKSFSFQNFIQGAKGAFKIIVEAYNNKRVEEIKHLVSTEVYNTFQKAADVKNSNFEIFNIISVNASILNIEVVNNNASIKVKFLSSQKVRLDNKTKNLENVIDIWTFEKDMTTNSLAWKLVEVRTD
ncbi:MAG: Tim44/TimA family putative adaptor protein [Pseudomonadota bacterium]|nr:Tim44/TimA family putative adaptor protein [Pseudomonadota bacterium]